MNPHFDQSKLASQASPPLDFNKLSPLAVTLDKLLRQNLNSERPEGEGPGLTEEILRDLSSSDHEIKTARLKQLNERLGGLNSTLATSFQLLADEASLIKEPLTLPHFRQAG